MTIRTTTLRAGAALLALGFAAACADQPIAPAAAPDAPAARNGGAALPAANLRLMVDTITRGLIENNTNAYDIPSAGARDTFRLAVDSILAGNVAAADALLDGYGYDVVRFRETVSNDTLVVVRERIPAGADVPRGWGTYIHNPRFAVAADIHVNHPVDDQNTEDMGGDLFRACRCRWFLMAGARRNANPNEVSDMARATNSIFHTVHVHVADSASRAVSMHGFSIANHADELPADADHVLAVGRNTQTTTPTYTAADLALRTALVDSGFVAGLHDLDAGYDALGATQNPQGRHSNDALGWGHWMHIEHERHLRTDSASWKASNRVIRRWLETNPAN